MCEIYLTIHAKNGAVMTRCYITADTKTAAQVAADAARLRYWKLGYDDVRYVIVAPNAPAQA